MPRCVIAAVCFAVVSPVTRTDAGAETIHRAGRLEAAYTATLLGLPIGDIRWTVELRDNHFSASAVGVTAGLLQIFARGHGTAEARGSIAGKQPSPSNFLVRYTHGSAAEEIKIAFGGGKAREYVAPPPKPNPNLVPLTAASRIGVVDPMTALLIRIPGNGDAPGPAACDRKVAVFDGRMRYDMALAFKRMEQVRTGIGYQGPAVVCAVYFIPLAGYDPTRYAIKYLQAERGIELWLAPLSGTPLMAPFRISVPTPIGVGILQATRFIWTPQNGHAHAMSAN